jgi:uncharacterized membrane protein
MSAAPTTARLLFADWLRGWALLVMIETHVFNAFLDAGLRGARWFGALNFANGLVAPSFLFVSGFVFLVASEKRLTELRALGGPFWKQLGRVGTVWVIGYLMHLPSYSPLKLMKGVSAQEWLWFYRVDVLHCISVTWVFLLVSLVVIRSDLWLRIWLAACALLLSAFAPMAWSTEFRPLVPAPVAAYLNAKSGSLFPVFPWSGFMLAGAVCASWFLAARRSGKERRLMAVLAGLGVAMVIAGHWLGPLRFLPEARHTDWWADPRTFLLRLGIVLLFMGAFYLYGVWQPPRKSVVLTVSRESLFVYVAHLLLIYGPYWGGKSAAEVVGRTQGTLVCLAASAGLAGLMVAGARAWSDVKRWKALSAAQRTADITVLS